uniref:Uncharacterized protein n=1 Tax=Zea mays TaxID=4577 RepID=B8A1U7_MAIZE|nr:unknown [Zea mays]
MRVLVRSCSAGARKQNHHSAGGGVGEGVEEAVGGCLGPVGLGLGPAAQALAGRAEAQRGGRHRQLHLHLHVQRRRHRHRHRHALRRGGGRRRRRLMWVRAGELLERAELL